MGDEIVEFGSVNTQNFQSLQNVGTVVQHSEGVSQAGIRVPHKPQRHAAHTTRGGMEVQEQGTAGSESGRGVA